MKLKKTHYSSDVKPSLDGKEIILAGWVREIRLHGNLAFIILADRSGDVQVTAIKKNVPKLFEKIEKLNREDAIAVKGKVKKTDQAKRGIEVILEDLEILNTAKTPLPLEITDKTPSEFDTRLKWRVLDLRRPERLSIFRIRNQILKSAREYFTETGFVEIETPKIIATATEGGAELFPVKYFDKDAFLRQSPQLYKELMTACFEKVFEIGPVFRAEPSDTSRHLAEVTQMDIEMGFADETDTWKILEGVVNRIYSDVDKNLQEDLEKLGVKDLKVPKLPFLRKSYDEMIELLAKEGLELKWGNDIPPEGERKIEEVFNAPVIVHDYPMEMKPYYIHPHLDDFKLSYGFDLLLEGMEISSGGRRIHDPELYVKMLKEKGLDPDQFEDITAFFRYGMPPHAGWSIGVDRLTMIIAKLKNIKEAVLFPRDIKRLHP